MKNYDTTGIEPANFRVVALCLSRLRHLVSQSVSSSNLFTISKSKIRNELLWLSKDREYKRREHMFTVARQQRSGGNYRVSERQEYVWQACSIVALEIIRIFDTKSNSQLLAIVSFAFRDKILKHIHTH